MSEPSNTRLYHLYASKEEKLQEVLNITKGVNLFESADCSEIYVEMIGKRAPIIEEIEKIDAEIFSITSMKPLSSEKLKLLIEEIISLDEKNNKIAGAILVDIKKELREIKSQQEVNHYYQTDNTDFGISVFDKMK